MAVLGLLQGLLAPGACAVLPSWEEDGTEHVLGLSRVFGGHFVLLLGLVERCPPVLTSFFGTLCGLLWMGRVLVLVFEELAG